VTIANFNRQHSWQAAEAADARGLLHKFITAVGYRSDTVVGRLVGAAGRLLAGPAGKRLLGRRLVLSRGVKLVSYPSGELIEAAYRRCRHFHRFLDPQTVKFARAELFDILAARHVGDCDVFHGFEQCAAFSLDAARRAGAVTLLDQSIIAWPSYAERLAAARLRFGLPAYSEPALFGRHVARKAQERGGADYFLGGLDEVRRTLEQAGVPGGKIFVIPYGADLTVFTPVVRTPSERLRLLFVGSLSWVKGLPFLLEALALLADPRISLRVFGGAEPEWQPLLSRMRRSLVAQGISVDFAGTVAQRELVGAFHEADAFVFPSLIGGVGLASLQAMATGLPSIAPSTDVILSDEGDVLIADPLDPSKLAAAIERLRADLKLRRHLSDGAVQTARRFTWAAYGRALVAAYERMLAGQPACTFLPGPGDSLIVREHSEEGLRRS